MTLFPPSRANRPGVGDSPEKWYNGGGRFNADLRAVPFKQETETMRVAWIQRQFLDYRCAVFEEFDRLCGGNLTVFTLRGFTPDKVFARAERFLGDRLVGITKEWILGSEEKNITAMPNKYLRICYPPGLVGMILGTKPDVVFSDAFRRDALTACADPAFVRTLADTFRREVVDGILVDKILVDFVVEGLFAIFRVGFVVFVAFIVAELAI